MTALVQAHGLGSSGDREFLLLGGCSAGGRGVLTNLDAFAGAAPPNVNVRGLLDAAGWVDVQPIIPDMLSLQQMSMDLFAFAQPNIPPSCANQYSGSEGWKCLWPSYRLPFVETEYFLNAAQYDAFQASGPRARAQAAPALPCLPCPALPCPAPARPAAFSD